MSWIAQATGGAGEQGSRGADFVLAAGTKQVSFPSVWHQKAGPGPMPGPA